MYLRFVLGIILITSIMLECIICRVKKLKGLQGLLWIVISFAFGFFLSSFFTYRINRIDRLIKIAIFVFMMGITELVLFFGVSRIKWRLKWFQCAFYPLLFVIGVIASFIAYGEKPSDYNGDLYSNLFWLKNYELGFSKRGLIGTIILLIKPYWSKKRLYCLKMSMALLFFALLILFFYEIYNITSKKFAVVLAFIVTCSPYAKLLFEDSVRTDVVLLLLFLITVMCVQKGGFWLIIVPITSALLILCNETSIATICPAMLMLCLYEYTENRKKRYLIAFILGVASSLIAACMIVLAARESVSDSEAVFAALSSHYEGNLEIMALRATYFTLSDHVNFSYQHGFAHWKGRVTFVVCILPLLYFFTCLFLYIYRQKKKNNDSNINVYFALMASLFLAFFPTILAVDWGRYALLFMYETAIIFAYLIRKGKIKIDIKDLAIGNIPNTYYIHYIICVVYAALPNCPGAP